MTLQFDISSLDVIGITSISLAQLLCYTEWLIALVFFWQKLELSQNQKSGWLIGGFGSILAVWYFYETNLFVYMIGNIGGVILSVYAYFYVKKNRLDNVDIILRIIIALFLFVVMIYTFQGSVSIAEFVSILCFYVAPFFFFLRKLRIAWATFLLAYMLGCYIGVVSGFEAYTYSQIGSMLVCLSLLRKSNYQLARHSFY